MNDKELYERLSGRPGFIENIMKLKEHLNEEDIDSLDIALTCMYEQGVFDGIQKVREVIKKNF